MKRELLPNVPYYDEEGNIAGYCSSFFVEKLGSDGQIHMANAQMAPNPDMVVQLSAFSLLEKALKHRMATEDVWVE